MTAIYVIAGLVAGITICVAIGLWYLAHLWDNK